MGEGERLQETEQAGPASGLREGRRQPLTGDLAAPHGPPLDHHIDKDQRLLLIRIIEPGAGNLLPGLNRPCE